MPTLLGNRCRGALCLGIASTRRQSVWPRKKVTAAGCGTGPATETKVLPAWIASSGHPPPLPDNCCGVGCVDCVWISYWERLNEFEVWRCVKGGGAAADAPKHPVPPAAVGGAGRGVSAASVYGQRRRLTGSSSGYKSAGDK